VGSSRGVRAKRTQAAADTRPIKEWARANGYQVADPGRISNEIRDAFKAAN
jgi:hypothetical protein